MSGQALVTFSLERATGILTLNRPEAGHAISTDMITALERTLDDIEPSVRTGERLRALILTASGRRFFCTGGDVKQYAGERNLDALKHHFARMQEVCRRLEQLPIPTIAAINGDAIGGGVELILACDFRIIAKHASLQFAQAKLGLATGWGGHHRLLNVVGYRRALELLLTCRRLDAGAALAYGLVDRVADGDSLQSDALSWAEEMQTATPAAGRIIKQMLLHARTASFADAMAYANPRFFMLWDHPDHRRAEQRFLRRKDDSRR